MKATMEATIAHMEIPADDIDRAKNFYAELFGWEFKEFGESGYWLFSIERGTKPLGGGMMKRMRPEESIVNYFDIPSIDEYSDKVTSLGGKIVVEKTSIPEMGYYCVCKDTEGNAFGLWEENKNAK